MRRVQIEKGYKQYWDRDKLHRDGGPAIEYNDGESYQYFVNGELHRLDGPATHICFNGKLVFESWAINGQIIDCTTQEQFERLIKLKAFL